MAAMVAGPSVAELSTDVGSTVEQLRELGETLLAARYHPQVWFHWIIVAMIILLL